MVRGTLILDRYEPIGTAGTGGFGTVQIAWDPRIQRKVAIKTIKLTEHDAFRAALPGAQAVSNIPTSDRWHGAQPWDEFLADGGDKPPESFSGERDWEREGDLDEGQLESDQVTSLAHLPGLDEARTAAMLSDPRIVTVYDFEVRGRIAYLIMEYVEGITLTRLLADYPDYLTLDMVAAVFDAVAGALIAAHGAGVLHLDIKPDNILINAQGRVKVTDFGLATLADASGTGTTGGGTIGYMPLEQMRREHLDSRTDEWSLAAVVYEMLTGDNPFRARNLEEAEKAIEDAELILPSLCWEDLDEQVDDVVFYALDPEREERYASVADFAEEMDKFLGNPDSGVEQLTLVVADALGIGFDDEPDEEDEEEPDRVQEKRGGLASGMFDRVLGLLAGGAGETGARAYAEADEGVPDEWDAVEELPDSRAVQRSRRERLALTPLANRVPERFRTLAPRLFSAAASGFTAFFSFSNMQILYSGFGPGTQYVVGAASVIIAVLAAFLPDVGAFLAFFLLGIAIILCGQPIVGAVVLVATVVWWYVIAHEAKASAGIALCMPVLGAIGGASAVPLLAGAALKPAYAIGTTAYAVILAFALGSLGTESLLGWGAFANWDCTNAAIASHALAMVKNVSTWTTAAGWIVAAAVFSLLRGRENRWLSIAGLALGIVAVVVGSLVFAQPSAELIVSVSCAAAALLIVYL